MALVTKAASKLKFQTGDTPTQGDFEDLHDSIIWLESGAPVLSDATTDYTSVLSDAGAIKPLNKATAINATIPPNSSVAFKGGAQLGFRQTGVGQATLVAGAGVTLNVPSGFTLRFRTQGSGVVVTRRADGGDVWDVDGDLESAIYVVKYLSADATANSTTTGASITGVETTLDVGTYNITAWIRYVSGATTTGVKFGIDHSGTTTMFMAQLRYAGTGTTASSGAATMAAAGATGNVYEAFSTRVKGTLLGPTVSIDSTGDAMMILECMMIVSVSGTVKLMHASEVAASSTVKAGTNLIINKVN